MSDRCERKSVENEMSRAPTRAQTGEKGERELQGGEYRAYVRKY